MPQKTWLTAQLFPCARPCAGPTRREGPLLAALGATGYAGYQLPLGAAEWTVPAGTAALLLSITVAGVVVVQARGPVRMPRLLPGVREPAPQHA
jgi:hypothetical protein